MKKPINKWAIALWDRSGGAAVGPNRGCGLHQSGRACPRVKLGEHSLEWRAVYSRLRLWSCWLGRIDRIGRSDSLERTVARTAKTV